MENNSLILCVRSSPSSLSKDMIPKNIKDEFKSIKINEMEQLFTIEYGITSGQKLHPKKDNANSYGTLGMIGSFHPTTGGNSTRCCISSAHVISANKTAFLRDATVLLGTCIWPPPASDYHINVQDISVIPLESNIQICRRQLEDVKLFEEIERHKLDKRKVFKFGATTGRTLGYVCKTDFYLEIDDPPTKVFLIEPFDKSDEESRFSKPGDSGAIVLTKFGQQVQAFSMIFGGEVNIEGVASNNSIAVELKHAVSRFEKASKNVLELDTL